LLDVIESLSNYTLAYPEKTPDSSEIVGWFMNEFMLMFILSSETQPLPMKEGEQKFI
jgi:hypothetical protein